MRVPVELRKRIAAGTVALVLGGALGRFFPFPAPTLVFLSVGQGSCAVLRAEGRTILFDAGPKTAYVDGGARLVVPKLRDLGIARIDAVVLSHPDLDHAGGLAAVLKAYPGAAILANAGFSHEPKLPGLLRDLGVEPSRIGWLPPFARLRIGSFKVDLASPTVVPGADDNDGSVLARLEGGAFIGGDAPRRVEAAYAGWIGPVDVLCADHHGSDTSGDPSLLSLARPRWIVVSVGRNNVYGHPNSRAMARYAATGARLLRTDRDGDVAFVLKNGRWERL